MFMKFGDQFGPCVGSLTTLAIFPSAKKLIHDVYMDPQKYFFITRTFHPGGFSILSVTFGQNAISFEGGY